jgi:DNA (cytosine-5)-methyltransferase 1
MIQATEHGIGNWTVNGPAIGRGGLGFRERLTARVRAQEEFELVVDNFAGAGGASLGIEAALGRCVDIAVNHSRRAVESHKVNHPNTRHLCEDVWDVDPMEVTAGRPVGLAWFSPDCKHFSKAKGGKPLSKKIRGLAWVVIRWAKAVRPRVIMLENVEEFQTWGPLDAHGVPIKARAGVTFERWKAQLRNLGYQVEHRELVAADYGVPTTRKRFFLIARCDGQPIVWPQATHAPRAKARQLKRKPWRAAAECIDWSLPCPSIFERKRPLAEATLRRIARGLRRYVIEAAEPFVVRCAHGDTGRWGTGCHGLNEPLPTQTATKDYALVSPSLVQTGYGEREGQRPRCQDIERPLGTVVGGGGKHGLVEAFLQRFRFGEAEHVDPRDPMQTVCAGGNHHAVVAPVLSKYHGAKPGDAAGRCMPPSEPFRTLDTSNRYGVVVPFLEQHGQTGSRGDRTSDVQTPLTTIVSKAEHCLACAHLTKLYGTCKDGVAADGPMPTVTGGGLHIAEVRSFLVKYYGSGDSTCNLRDPMDTITALDRMGLVTVEGHEYQIVDIGLRMLQPTELLRAQFGRFADEYVLHGTKKDQVAGIGNSVCPEQAEALVAANVQIRQVNVISRRTAMAGASA